MCNKEDFEHGLGIGFVIGLFIVGTVMLIVMGFACTRAENNIKRQAIEAGVAEYRIDKKTGVSEFIFIKHGDQSKNEIGTLITPLEK